jgi:hypothetical protein
MRLLPSGSPQIFRNAYPQIFRNPHYRVSIHLGLPGHELLVSHAPSDEHHVETAGATADRAFDEVGRQLEDWVRRQRVHRHEAADRS